MPHKKTVLILGGGGFIGSHLVEALRQEYDIVVFDKKHFSRDKLKCFDSEIKVVEGDFNNPDDWRYLLDGADYILHLVWSTLPANLDTIYDIESNIVSTLKLLEIMKEKKQHKVIFMSSGGTVYGTSDELPLEENGKTNPICSYGITKLMVEKFMFMYSHLYGLDYCVVRLTNPYGERQGEGSRQGLINVALRSIVKGIPLKIWGDGEIIRDYIYIKDAVDCVVRMLKYSGPERIFNVSSSVGYSINAILKEIRNITGTQVEVIYDHERRFDLKNNVLSNALAKRELNWRPLVPLKRGIELAFRHIIEEEL